MEESKIPAARAYARNIRMMNPRHAAEANMDVDSALPAPAAAGGVAPMTTSDAPAPEMTRYTLKPTAEVRPCPGNVT